MTGSARVRRRFRLFGVVVPLLLIMLTACFGGSSRTVSTGSLAVSSDPPGAEIFLDGKPTGHKTPYKFVDLAPGTYDVTLVLQGYPQQGPRGVIVRNGEITPLSISMRSTTVNGRVVFGRGGPPVAGSIIRAYRENSNDAADETTSDPDGSFTLDLPPGRYDIIARQPDTWAAGVARAVEVPANGPVEIIQRDLFAHGDSGNPQSLSIRVTGLEPGDIVTGPVDITVEVEGENAAVGIRYIGLRVGHQAPHGEDQVVHDRPYLQYRLNPPDFGPGTTYLHVAAYDVQLNSAQLVIPFTIPPNPAGGGEALPAPGRVAVTSYTFLTPMQAFGAEQMGALADAMSPYGVTPADLAPEVIPPYNRWVRVAWDWVPGAAGYRVYRRAEGSDDSAVVADWSRSEMYIDASGTLSPGTRYYYTVRAYDQDGQLGQASVEVPIVLLEPFEVRLVEPADQAHVPWWSVTLRWERNSLPPLPGSDYEYVYRVAYSGELSGGGLGHPEFVETVRDREYYQPPSNFIVRGRSYHWDLIAAYATVQISETSRAFSVSGRYHPLRDGFDPGGGSVNGAFRFTAQP